MSDEITQNQDSVEEPAEQVPPSEQPAPPSPSEQIPPTETIPSSESQSQPETIPPAEPNQPVSPKSVDEGGPPVPEPTPAAPEPPPISTVPTESPKSPAAEPPKSESFSARAKEWAAKALGIRRAKKEKNFQKILDYLAKHKKITNDQVEKLLKVGNTAAFKYLTELEKRGLVRQVGRTGKSVYYELNT